MSRGRDACLRLASSWISASVRELRVQPGDPEYDGVSQEPVSDLLTRPSVMGVVMMRKDHYRGTEKAP